MYPYYILNTNNFNILKNGYSIPVQSTLDGVIGRDPGISFTKKDGQYIKNHLKYDLVCESKKKQRGRAYDSDLIFEYFISIDEKYCYFNETNNTFILETSKQIFTTFYNAFSKKGSYTENVFKKLNIDFIKIIDNQHSLGVKGIWLGDYGDTNIDALYLMGNKIEDSSQYQQLINRGATISNVTILYNYNNKLTRVMLTKDSGIILYNKLDTPEALLLVEDVYNKLLCA